MSRVGQFGQISTINDHLCLSGSGVLKPEKIKERRITCIVSATTEEASSHVAGVDYLRVRVDDSPLANLDTYFDLVADKIKSVKDHGGRTLVHCVAGVSRSASLCIVYLIKYGGLTLRQAYFHVKSIRTIIHPNPGFWRQMIAYEMRLTGKNTVKLKTVADGGDIPDLYTEGRRPLPALHFRTQVNGSHKTPSSQQGLGSYRSGGYRSPSLTSWTPSGGGGYGGYRRASPAARSARASPRSSPNMAGLSIHSGGERHHQGRSGRGNLFSSLYDSHHSMFFPHL